MTFTLATWNINSVRLRENLVAKLMLEEQPDVLCLQECKSPIDKIPLEQFQALGYSHIVARGQKGYNGVAILSKLPISDAGDQDFATMGHARRVDSTAAAATFLPLAITLSSALKMMNPMPAAHAPTTSAPNTCAPRKLQPAP